MGELVKIESFSREIALAESIEELSQLNIKGELMAEMARKLEIPLHGQNELGRTRIELSKKLREIIEQKFPHKGRGINQYNKELSSKDGNLAMKDAGIDKHTSSDAKVIKEEDELVNEVMKEIEEKGEVITPKKVASETRKKKKEQKKEQRKEEYKKQSETFNDDNIKIFHAKFQEHQENFPDDSVDLILTDPPYPKDFLPLWQDLFSVASRVLKPSAFLVAYSGQLYLDEIFRMENELIYYWTANIVFSKKPLIHARNVINEWKPILIFQKPPFKKISDTISDTISFNYSERDMHEKNWGQTIKPFEFLIDKFSNPGDLVFEPFAGTGTTLLAAKRMKRICIGTEIEEEYIDLIKGRLNEE